MHFCESDHYGGARVKSSWTELIDDKISNDKVGKVDELNQGEDFEER